MSVERQMHVNDRLSIKTFGGLTISVQGQPITGFVSRKVPALLVYLACNPREHPREILGEMLWDDLSQTRTLSNLRTVLSNLQQFLAPYLIVTRQSVSINPETDIDLDILRFDQRIVEAEQMWQANRSYSRLEAARVAESLAMYEGHFLDGFFIKDARGFEGWKLLEQERLRHRAIEMLHRLAQNALNRGWYSDGLQYVNRLLAYDPLWEEGHRMLMRLLAYNGQRSAALAQYTTLQSLLQQELGVDPSDETFDLYCQIDDGLVNPILRTSTMTTLPIPTTHFIERPAEMQQILNQMDKPACRLLTIIGNHGVGKTRLALESSFQRMMYYPEGILYIPLENAQTEQDVIAAILRDTGETTETFLLNKLREKERLLILDNFEHLLHTAPLLSRILENAPQINIIVTSTRRLNLREEWLVRIGGFPVPAEGVDVSLDPGAQLFAQTAERVRPDFNLNTEAQAVLKICRLVDGMPLAIELAAEWVQMLSCDQIAARLEQDLDFLTSTSQNIPERQRSIRNLFIQMTDALTPEEQDALHRLASVDDTFTLEDAEKVHGVPLRTLMLLMEQSLVSNQPPGRYEVPSLLRRHLRQPTP